MRRTALLTATALIAAACAGSGGSSSSSSATASTAGAAPTTTTTTEVGSAAADVETAMRDVLDAIDEHGVAATVESTGTLSEDGTFLDDYGVEGVPGIDIDVRAVVDAEGVVWFAVFANPEALLGLWIEFDAVTDDGTVVAETSVIGLGEGPYWVEDAPNGSVITIDPDTGLQSLRPVAYGADLPIIDGYWIRTDISVFGTGLYRVGSVPGDVQDPPPPSGVRISGWLTLSLSWLDEPPPEDIISPGTAFLYWHLEVEREDLPPQSPLDMYLHGLRLRLDESSLPAEWRDAADLGPRDWVVGLRVNF